MADLDWKQRGDCASDADPEAWFVSGAAQHTPAADCRRCPVIATCLAYALDTGQEYGVWGGQTERERRALLAKHPEIEDWHHVLVTSRG